MSLNISMLRLLLISFVSTFAAMFQFGYLSSIVNPAQGSLTIFINTSYHNKEDVYLNQDTFNWIYSFIVNCYQIGFLIGTLLTPFAVEKFGRKWSLISSGVFDFLGTAIQVIAFPFEVPVLLVVGRMIAGIGSGIGSGAVTLYIQEISPTKIRGLLSSFQAINNNITTLIGMVLGLPTILGSLNLLPYMMAVGFLPGILKLFFIFCPDTPKYLLLKRQNNEGARNSIIYYHGPDADVDHVLKEISKEGDDEDEKFDSDHVKSSWKVIQIIKTPHLRKALILGSVALCALNCTGIIPLTEYSTYLLTYLGVDQRLALLIAILIGVSFTLTSILSLLLVEICGRKKLLLFGYVGIILMLIIFMACYFIEPSPPALPSLKWPGYLACGVLLIHVGVFGLGPGTIPWYITAELVPMSVRSTAQSITQVFNVLGSFVFSFSFLPLFDACGPYSFLALFIIPTTLVVIYLYFELPETKNREITDIVADLKRKSKKEKILQK